MIRLLIFIVALAAVTLDAQTGRRQDVITAPAPDSSPAHERPCAPAKKFPKVRRRSTGSPVAPVSLDTLDVSPAAAVPGRHDHRTR